MRRIERTMGGEAREKFAAFIPDGDMGEFAAGLAKSIENDFTAAMKMLRDPNFQDLLLNYPRARKHFLVGYEVEDKVSSEERDYKLDITWLKDETMEDADDLPEPHVLASEAITELEAVVDDLRDILGLIEMNGEEGTEIGAD